MFPSIVDGERIEATGDAGLIRSLQLMKPSSRRQSGNRVSDMLSEVRAMISHSKSEESLSGHRRDKRMSRNRQRHEKKELTIMEMDMRRLDNSVRRLYPHARKKGSIIGGLGAFSTTLIPSKREAPGYGEWRQLTRILRTHALPKTQAVPVIQSWYRGCKERDRWKRRKALLYFVAIRLRFRAQQIIFKKKWLLACEHHARVVSMKIATAWAAAALQGKRETLIQVYQYRLKRMCGKAMHAWSAHAKNCKRVRKTFRRAHKILSATGLIIHVANLREIARVTKQHWLSFAESCTRRRLALTKIFIACIPPSYDNSSMQIMLWSFAKKMWKRVGARRYFRQWKRILGIRAKQLLRAVRHCNSHASTKYGSPCGRGVALAKFFYTCEKVISRPEPAPDEAYDVRYNFGRIPSAFIQWIAYAREKSEKAARFRVADRANRPIALKRGIRALAKNTLRKKWMKKNIVIGDAMFERRAKENAYDAWKRMWKRRKMLACASLAFSARSYKSKVMFAWKRSTRCRVIDAAVASAVLKVVNYAEATWYVCKGDAFRHQIGKMRGMRALSRRVLYMSEYRELEQKADTFYRNICFRRWNRVAKTHFEYVYAALLIQNRMRIRFARRVHRSKVRMVLAKQAVQRDKLEDAIKTLYDAALPFQRLWRGHKGKKQYAAFQKQVWDAFRELQAKVRARGIQDNKEKAKDLEYYWDAELERNRLRSCIKIQAWFRACWARKGHIKQTWANAKLRHIREKIAAQKIQIVARRRRDAKSVHVKTIQRWMRGIFARLRVRNERRWQRYDKHKEKAEVRASYVLRKIFRVKSHRITYGVIGVMEMLGILRVTESDARVRDYKFEERDRLWRRDHYNHITQKGSKLEKFIAKATKRTVWRVKEGILHAKTKLRTHFHPLEGNDLPPVTFPSVDARNYLEDYGNKLKDSFYEKRHKNEIARENAALTIQRHFRLQTAKLKWRRHTYIKLLSQDRPQNLVRKLEKWKITSRKKQFKWAKRLLRNQPTGRHVNGTVEALYERDRVSKILSTIARGKEIYRKRRNAIADDPRMRRRERVSNLKYAEGCFFYEEVYDQPDARGGSVKFTGTWRDGVPFGYGTCHYLNTGNSRKFKSAWGAWRNGSLLGPCRIELTHGGSYHGCIDPEGNKCGAGKFIFPYAREDHEWEAESKDEEEFGDSDDEASSVMDFGESDDDEVDDIEEPEKELMWGIEAREDVSLAKTDGIADDILDDGAMPKRIWNLDENFSLREKFPFDDGSKVASDDKHADSAPATKVQWSTYEGSFEDDAYHGEGILRLADGLSYKGQFQKGKYSGMGFIKYPNGGEYSGEFKDGMRWGDGKMEYENGDWYDGEWRCGKPHGHGSLYIAQSKEKFVGEYVKGKRQGRIMVFYSNGDRRAGEWSEKGTFTKWLHKRISVAITHTFVSLFRENADFSTEFAISVLGVYDARSHMEEEANRMPDHVDHEDLRVKGILRKIRSSIEQNLMLEGRERLSASISDMRRSVKSLSAQLKDAENLLDSANEQKRTLEDMLKGGHENLDAITDELRHHQWLASENVARCDGLLEPLWEVAKEKLRHLRTFHATSILNYSTPPDQINICVQLYFQIWSVHFGNRLPDGAIVVWNDAVRMFYDDQLVPTIDKMNQFLRFDWKVMRKRDSIEDVMRKVGSLLAEPHYDFGADQMVVGAMWSVIHAWYASASAAISLHPFRSKVECIQREVSAAKENIQSLKLKLFERTQTADGYMKHKTGIESRLKRIKAMLADSEMRIVQGRLSAEEEKRRDDEARGLKIDIHNYEELAEEVREIKLAIAVKAKKAEAMHAEHKVAATKVIRFEGAIAKLEKERKDPLKKVLKKFKRLNRDDYIAYYELGPVPPRLCSLVAKGVMGLLGAEHITWAELRRRILKWKEDQRELTRKKAYMSKEFVLSIMKFNLESINPVSAYQVTKMIRGDNFDSATLKEEVLARKGADSNAWLVPSVLLEWLICVERYEKLERSIAPMRTKYRDARDEKIIIDDKVYAVETELEGYRARIQEVEEIFAGRRQVDDDESWDM